jgi:hypothetical protein
MLIARTASAEYAEINKNSETLLIFPAGGEVAACQKPPV